MINRNDSNSNSNSNTYTNTTNSLENFEFNSKRRKTTHTGDNNIVVNPMKIYDLNVKSDDQLEIELNSYNPEIDFVINMHKKRTFAKIDNETKMLVSKIPKPTKNTMIVYSKYSNIPTLIPKFNEKFFRG
jgi:hypothetical protein